MTRARTLLIATILAAGLAGCSESPVDSDASGTWFVTKGIQCEPPPWEQWANEKGIVSAGDEAKEPFTYDERRAMLMAAYYAETDPSIRSTWAFFDDRAYPSVCGAANQWNYWVLADEAPGDMWVKPDMTPQEAQQKGKAGEYPSG